ncbi:MAG: hypothetical protein IKX60_04330 [Bacteroidales bacterium]|nr:hypothetical protein [Bacteroidales bacterium]
MQLPQYIIDLVGTLLDDGQDDESICSAAIEAWRAENDKASSARLAGICGPVYGQIPLLSNSDH